MINKRSLRKRENQIIALSELYRDVHYFCKERASCEKIMRNFPFTFRSDEFLMLSKSCKVFYDLAAIGIAQSERLFLIPNINYMCDFVFNFYFQNCR